MSIKSKKMFIMVGIFIMLFIVNIYADKWDYDIKEAIDGTDDFLDNTDLIVDYENQEIRLNKENGSNPIKFMNEDNAPIAYSVMTDEGIITFAYDGQEMIEMANLKIETENPLAFVTKRDAPDTIVISSPENNECNLEYYSFDGSSMSQIPFLEINGLTEVMGLSFINDNISVLNNDSLLIYGQDDNSLIDMPFFKIDELKNPLDIAADNNFNISILNEDKITQYNYDGEGFSEIPSLSIVFNDYEDIKNPKYIVIANDTRMIIDEDKVHTFMLGEEKMQYVKSLSITDSLAGPKGIALNRNSNDLIILDEEEDVSVIRYYKKTKDEYVEIKDLSMELKDIIISGGSKYDLEGVFISKAFPIKNDVIDEISIGVYSKIEDDTEIVLSIYNGYEKSLEKDSELWRSLWKLTKEEGRSILYKNISKEDEEWIKFKEGKIDEIYPINISDDEIEEERIKPDELEVIEDDEGNLYLNSTKEIKDNKYFDLSIKDIDTSKDSYVIFKMDFTSADGKNTPKVFVPSTKNEIEDVRDDIAILIKTRYKEVIPEIIVIEDKDLYDPEYADFPNRDMREGWVYTSTPIINWKIPKYDTDYHINDRYQKAFQVIIMAENEDGRYKPALITDIIDEFSISEAIETIREYQIPKAIDHETEGPLYASGSYKFSTFIRIWDDKGQASRFSTGFKFNVLAFDRPRIINIKSTPYGEMTETIVIKEHDDELLQAKAGTAVVFAVDSIGPIENDLEDDISIIYFDDYDSLNYVKVNKGGKVSKYEEGSPVNTYNITYFSEAPVTKIKDGTIIKGHLWGKSNIGGTTILPIPGYARGLNEIKSTVYKDWEVYLDGRRE